LFYAISINGPTTTTTKTISMATTLQQFEAAPPQMTREMK